MRRGVGLLVVPDKSEALAEQEIRVGRTFCYKSIVFKVEVVEGRRGYFEEAVGKFETSGGVD